MMSSEHAPECEVETKYGFPNIFSQIFEAAESAKNARKRYKIVENKTKDRKRNKENSK
jgi:hypothetical protein